MCAKVSNRACECNQKENLLNRTVQTILCPFNDVRKSYDDHNNNIQQ